MLPPLLGSLSISYVAREQRLSSPLGYRALGRLSTDRYSDLSRSPSSGDDGDAGDAPGRIDPDVVSAGAKKSLVHAPPAGYSSSRTAMRHDNFEVPRSLRGADRVDSLEGPGDHGGHREGSLGWAP